jgi:hypothetical protein
MQPPRNDLVLDHMRRHTGTQELAPGDDAVLALGEAGHEVVGATRPDLGRTIRPNSSWVAHGGTLAPVSAPVSLEA